MHSVIIIGPAHPFRGGLSTFNERLAREFQNQGYDTSIFTFTLQYPEFIFPGTTQFSETPPPPDLKIFRRINSVNPLNWLLVGNELKKLNPTVVVVRYWLPLMGPALGTILRILKLNGHTRIIAITDNVIPHEKRIGDTVFTKYFLKPCDAFIAMSENVMRDLKKFVPNKRALQVYHPLYDSFGEAISKESARKKLGIDNHVKVLLFFGFIRNYKGLDVLFEAMALLMKNPAMQGLKLLVAGEFYEDEKPYQDKIDQLNIRSILILKTTFIPDTEVVNYFCAADLVVQPYRNATQSGVTPLAYHFEKPMIVTNVGSLPVYVPHEKAGLVARPDPASIAAAIQRYFELGESYFIPHLRSEKQKFSWKNLVKAIEELSNE
ncbi:MAG TPA: glycosyltransferase [Chitinophagaceae bacterium]|nr:glycosyltransferase [Chitinophagaceae bacterium]